MVVVPFANRNAALRIVALKRALRTERDTGFARHGITFRIGNMRSCAGVRAGVGRDNPEDLRHGHAPHHTSAGRRHAVGMAPKCHSCVQLILR